MFSNCYLLFDCFIMEKHHLFPLWGIFQGWDWQTVVSGPKLAFYLFLYSPQVRMVLIFLNGWGKKWKGKEYFVTQIQISVSLNKASLEHSPARPLTCCLRRLSFKHQRSDEAQLRWTAHEAKSTAWLFTEKVCQPLPNSPTDFRKTTPNKLRAHQKNVTTNERKTVRYFLNRLPSQKTPQKWHKGQKISKKAFKFANLVTR